MSSSKGNKNGNNIIHIDGIGDTEQIQLLSLKPKHHNPPPKRVVSNKADNLTPDIVWSDPVPKCFLYSCIGVAIIIFIIIIHNTNNTSHTGSNNNTNHIQKHVSANSNPHIIWFIFDDLGQADFSYHGSEYSTPNIDNLATSGIELLQHYVSPICSATRSSLLTGIFAYKMGLQGVLMDYIHPSTISHIPIKYQTVANYLNNIGYNTKIYGKWHAGYSKQSYTPLQRGFKTHIGYYQYAINPFNKNNLDHWEKGKDWFVNGQFVDDTHYASDILLDSILDDLDGYSQGDEPLFMYISFSNPHFPVTTPNEFNILNMDKCAHIINEERQKYCLSVIYLDNAIGEIINKLKEKHLYKNSVIGMLSDNGPQILDLCGTPGEHIAAGSAYPLRGAKYTLFQGGVKTSAFISGGVIENKLKGKKGEKTSIIMSAVDWMPTLLHFTDFYENGNSLPVNMDGIDLYDEIFNDNGENNNNNNNVMYASQHRDYLILSMEYNENENKYINTGIIYNNYKLLINNKLSYFGDNSCNLRSSNPKINDGKFKSIIIDAGDNVPDLMLFSLENDENEYSDLLKGSGSKNNIFNDNDSDIKQLVVAMIKILDDERKYNIPDIKTQSFEHFDKETHETPIDIYLINGIHQPFQSENEQEFPVGYNY